MPNPRHLSNEGYLALARAAALRGAGRNGAAPERVSVDFPDAGFAPNRVTVAVSGHAHVRVTAGDPTDPIEVSARATAELTLADEAGFGMPSHADGGGYRGPLSYRQGKPMPHLFSAL